MNLKTNKMKNIYKKYQHIYITSNEEIEEGDWRYNSIDNTVYQKKFDKTSFAYEYKIILTTDQDLIKEGVQKIDDTFLEWFVKNPSCESVEVSYEVLKPFQSEEKGYLIHCPDNEVLEEPKQLTDLEIAIKLEEIQREEPKQQSAVEWLEFRYKNNINLNQYDFEQAKEMEKQQIIDAWKDGAYGGGQFTTTFDNEEQYYNETFKNK